MVDRMSALDAEFLHMEDGVTHMHIASCAVFEGPPLSDEEGEAMMRDALPRIPRYRQRVHFVPFQLGRPVWADDPDFDLADHLFRVILPAPGDAGQLADLMAELMSEPLDRGRPLWEAWVIEGLEDGRWALVSKVHHCMVDGIAGTGLMEQVLATEPTPAVPPDDDDWAPEEPPTDTRLAIDALGEAVATIPRIAGDVLGWVGDPGETLRQARTLGQGLWSTRHEMLPAPDTSIEGTVGPRRRWAGTAASLDDVRLVRKNLGGTVNDVVLTGITRGFRDLLESRGEDPDVLEVRTLVPVSVRTDPDAVDNEVTGMIAELPVQEADPVARLEAVRAEIDRLKDSHEIELSEALLGLVDVTPPPVMAWGTRATIALLNRAPQRNVMTVTTNVPGPQYPLFAGARRMVAYYPFVPISIGIRFGVAILSYDGTLYFGVTGDYDTAPDVGVLAAGIDAGMRELTEVARATG